MNDRIIVDVDVDVDDDDDSMADVMPDLVDVY